jgi:2-(1,2-epoxy-1,2-dihydrophenyl)acetyl-CoA isomerase
MSYENIVFDEADGLVSLTLNRPQALNALSLAMLEEMADALDRIRDEGTARALLITGAGRAFCSGADLAPAPDSGARRRSVDAGAVLETHYNPIVERLAVLPVPVVAAVNGPAAGGGCSLALAADIVVASKAAYFLQAFVNIGLVPDVGSTWVLPRLIGRARAQAMMMLGERIPAETAEAWGMIWKVVEPDALMDEARAVAVRFAQGPTRALSLIRTGARECLEVPLSQALQIERRNQRMAGASPDFAEGVSAFLQKRPAKFTGR